MTAQGARPGKWIVSNLIVLTQTDDPAGMEFKQKLDKEFQKRISIAPAWEAIQ